MTTTSKEIAQVLVTTLNELMAVHEEQTRRAEISKQRADKSQSQLMEMLRAAQSDDASEARKSFASAFNPKESFDDTAIIHQNQRRWTIAITKCDGLLMRLYAFAEAQDSAGKIAGCIKSIRLLDIPDEEMIAPPTFDPTPHFRQTSEGDDTAEERKQRKVGMALDFFSGMDNYLPKVNQYYADRTAQTTQLLRQAKDEAERLLLREESQT